MNSIDIPPRISYRLSTLFGHLSLAAPPPSIYAHLSAAAAEQVLAPPSSSHAPLIATTSAVKPIKIDESEIIVNKLSWEEESERERIHECLALLYENYVTELNWDFSRDNPSGIHAEMHNGKDILMDQFVRKAVYFAAIYKGEVIGTARLTSLDKNYRFEVEGYRSSQPIWPILKKYKPNCFELSRVAVKSLYGGNGVCRRLFSALLQHCEGGKSAIYVCTSGAQFIKICDYIKWPLVQRKIFKYEEQDPEAVDLYLANVKDIANMRKKLGTNWLQCNL
jgi:hypothetical protein